jgi:4-alpha-glucanotransferase
VAAVQLEDWIGLDTPVNVPGTGSEYPNWRRKLPQTWEELLEREDVWALARVLSDARGA